MMEKRFTNRANEAISQAYSAAVSMGHNYIGSEHILLGLLREKEGVAARVLAEAGVTAEAVTERIKENIGIGDPGAAPQDLTPRSKLILNYASEESLRLGHNYIGTEHILLGIIREGDNVAARILYDLTGDLRKLISMILRAIGEGGSDSMPGPEPASSPMSPRSQKGMAHRGAEPKLLKEFGRNLNALAGSSLDPVIGRNEEINRVIQILSRRTEQPRADRRASVNKTAIVENRAKIVLGDIPELKSKSLYADLAGIIAGTSTGRV